MLLSLDVALPAGLWPKSHRSYFVWEYGKPPDVVVEVVSNEEGREQYEKLGGYARIGIRYYVIYDPERILNEEPLAVFSWTPRAIARWLTRCGCRVSNCRLRLWAGRYEDHENTWLHWTDAAGTQSPTEHKSATRLVRPNNSGVWGYRRLSDTRYSRRGTAKSWHGYSLGSTSVITAAHFRPLLLAVERGRGSIPLGFARFLSFRRRFFRGWFLLRFERRLGRSRQNFATRMKAGAMARTVPGFLRAIPVDQAAHVRAVG